MKYLLILLLLSGCGREQVDRRTHKADKRKSSDLSLSLNETEQQASKFCPSEKPQLPEDPTPPHRFQTTLLKQMLGGSGLRGWIHGSVPRYQHYVFTYRSEDPNDPMRFFKAEQFSLVTTTAEAKAQLAQVNRHDQIKVFGKLIAKGSPLRHIRVERIEMVKAYEKATNNDYTFDPSSIPQNGSFDIFGKVHATAYSEKQGYGFVLEHKNFMLPIVVHEQHEDIAKGLFRNDIVNVTARLVHHKNRPPHVETEPTVDQGIQMVDPMVHCHGIDRELEGFLVKFDKSPAISRDVFALRIIDANGIGRNFTFFPNHKDPKEFGKLFQQISAKASAVWNDGSKAKVVRNFHMKSHIKVRANGMMNVVSPSQANPQVYLTSIENLEFSVE